MSRWTSVVAVMALAIVLTGAADEKKPAAKDANPHWGR